MLLIKDLFLTSIAMYINAIAIYSILQCRMFLVELATGHIFVAVTGDKNNLKIQIANREPRLVKVKY